MRFQLMYMKAYFRIQPCVKALIQLLLTKQWFQITRLFFWTILVTYTTKIGLLHRTQKAYGHLQLDEFHCIRKTKQVVNAL